MGVASVPDAVAPPPRHPRFPLVDGVRAIAVLCVVVVHAAGSAGAVGDSIAGRLLAHLDVGVSVFFVISGFLLYRPFIAWRTDGPESPAVRDYARRRALRILPAYWLVLTVLVVVPGVTGVYGGEWVQQYGLLHWLPLGEGGGCTAAYLDCGLAQTWSLVVEVSFYAALPLYAIVASRFRTRHWARNELLLLAGLSAVSVTLATVDLEGGGRTWVAGTFGGYVLWFAIGLGFAIASVASFGSGRTPPALRPLSTRPALCWTLALAIFVALSLVIEPTSLLLTDVQGLLAHVCFAAIAGLLILPAIFDDRAGGLPRRVLGHPVVAWSGVISYGVFLWHYVFALELGVGGAGHGFAVVLIGTLAGAVACAAISYYALERPLLRLKHRRLRR